IAGLESTIDPQLRERERAYLDGVVQKLTAAAPVPVKSALLDGPVVDVLQETAGAVGADLVVMTTHGRGPVSRFWLGSVTDELVRRLPMPLLLVRPHEREPALGPEPRLGPLQVPMDGWALAEQILPAAVELGRLMQARFTLLRVVEPFTPAGFGPAGYPIGGYVPPELNELRAEAQAYLDGVAGRLRG